jgi:hypothetical protein
MRVATSTSPSRRLRSLFGGRRLHSQLNGADPQAWPADDLARIAGYPIHDLSAQLPWCWAAEKGHRKLAA